MTSGVSEDAVSNSLCFKGTNPASDVTALTGFIKSFYDSINATCLPGEVATSGHIIKWTDLPGVKPNYPFDETIFNLAVGPSGATLPAECSIVLSFQGDKAAGFPQARRRGRIFIGPIDAAANSTGRPSAGAITALSTAAATLKSNVLALAGDTQWAVWSPSDGAAVEITDGWVDNSFDTQRRRGIRTNSRTTWS